MPFSRLLPPPPHSSVTTNMGRTRQGTRQTAVVGENSVPIPRTLATIAPVTTTSTTSTVTTTMVTSRALSEFEDDVQQ